jgi:spore maturation protein CgeB
MIKGGLTGSARPLRLVFVGLSITSSWGNGHATNYRGLLGELAERGHDVLFLERDMPWYAKHRDMPRPPFGRTELYSAVDELESRFGEELRRADAVILGSYVPEGVAAGELLARLVSPGSVLAFYDIDTPVTLAKLERGDYEYLSPGLIGHFDLYLSFTGGPTLARIEREFGCPRARAFYCMVDPDLYRPAEEGAQRVRFDLGYLGTYSADRQPPLERLMLEPARERPQGRYIVAGPQYPAEIRWPRAVRRLEHLPPALHRRFYTMQRFTLNITRADMIRAGYSPSVRLFEAAACGTPIISDIWDGIETLLSPGKEILLAKDSRDVLEYLEEIPEPERRAIGLAARRRVLAEHTAAHRAMELEEHIGEVLSAGPGRGTTRQRAQSAGATGAAVST